MKINWKREILTFVIFAAVMFTLLVLFGGTVASALTTSIIAGVLFSVTLAIYTNRKNKK